jgi:hypothetical protein
MNQQHAGELPTTHADVDQLLDDLQHVARHVKPVGQQQESGSLPEETQGMVVKGR